MAKFLIEFKIGFGRGYTDPRVMIFETPEKAASYAVSRIKFMNSISQDYRGARISQIIADINEDGTFS